MNFIVNRTINVCIRTTYYTFCMCNNEWENPTFKLVKTDTNTPSNMPYYSEYYCKSGWKVVNSFLFTNITMWSLKSYYYHYDYHYYLLNLMKQTDNISKDWLRTVLVRIWLKTVRTRWIGFWLRWITWETDILSACIRPAQSSCTFHREVDKHIAN